VEHERTGEKEMNGYGLYLVNMWISSVEIRVVVTDQNTRIGRNFYGEEALTEAMRWMSEQTITVEVVSNES
jgi:hypothetical protein